MNAEANKSIVQDYVAAFNAFDMERLAELFAPDAKIYGVLGFGALAEVAPIWRELHEGMNMRLEALDIAVDGSNVVGRFRETGRFTGTFRGLAGHEPTGRPYEIMAMEWFVVENGRISCRWGARDSAAISRQCIG
ncbi:nuclear transport factor 2 family protein [Rhizobium sp. ARZ01]|uniref:nuclear transport factor 2 family protein n=1 Tax=Rhizobium sp. ARZ01 TaxID=2769313 RepID=UPI00178753CB|nr:nuclear transport factor 2 family protein [Rhizobium sp. ARZ01]